MRRCLFLLVLVALSARLASAQTNYSTAPGAQSGTPAYGAFFSADIDNINVYNGNLNLSIPLFSLPGRELSMGVSLSYNSREWEQHNCYGSNCSLYTGGWRAMTSFGDNALSFFAKQSACTFNGTSWVPQFEMNVYWIDGSGSKRRYMDKVDGSYCGGPAPNFDSRTFTSLDGDGSKLYTGQYNSNGSDTAYILFKDGTKRYFRTAYSSSSISYDLITPNGNYLVRDTNGLPTQDTLGRTATFETNYSSSPTSYYERYKITDANGTLRTYQVNYTYPSMYDPYAAVEVTLAGKSRHISSIDLPNGQSWQFEYNTDAYQPYRGFLSKVTYPTGAYIAYAYNSNGVISRKVNADGSEKTWGYSQSGSDRYVTDPEGGRVKYGYNSTGTAAATSWQQLISNAWHTLKTVESAWSQTAVEANGQANRPRMNTVKTFLNGNAQSTQTITYDSDNDVTQQKVTEWSFGAAGPVVSQADTTYTTIASSFKRVASKTLTAINPATGSSATQGKTEYSYDDYSLTDRGSGVPNHTHSTTASGRGNLTKTRAYKDASNYLETQMKYDNVGNLVETIDPLSHSTTVDFTDNFTDTSKNGSKFAFPKKVTNALSQYATSKYNYDTGLVMEVTNVRGSTTTTAYDLMNRITSVTEPPVSGVSKVTTYAYDDTNRKTTKEVTVDTSPNKGHVETTFDKLYRTVKTTTNDPQDSSHPIMSDTEYDGTGRVKKTSNPYRSGDTVVWTQTTYDGLSRPATVTAPDSSTVQYAYANNVTTTTDQAGNQRRYTYNVLGQLTMVEEPSPTLATPAVTTYKYYGFGPLYQSTQSTQTRTWVYNWLGQMTSETLPESGTTSFTYDGAGRLYTKTDARSVVTTMTYDNANRLTQRSYSDSTPTVSFTYDQSSQTGLRTKMTDGLGDVTYTYDTMNRLTQESRANLPGISGTFSTSYVYNVKGDVTQMTYPSGRVVNFAYATAGGCCNSRLSSVEDDTTNTMLLESIAFNAAGGVTSQTLNPGSNAISESFTYSTDGRLQLKRIQATKGSTTVMDFGYDYGTSSTNTGRVLKRTDALQPEHSANYVYDSLYRLTQAAGVDGSWAVSWALDTWGNRTSQTPSGLATSKVGSQTLGYSNNKLTGDQYLSYDSAGNLTHEAGSSSNAYAYNAENQQISLNGGAATYGYDGEGRRMKKYTSTETTYTFYGPGGILSEFTITDTGAPAASSTDKTIYRTSEKTGTAVLLFNSSGMVIENNRTLPYGEAWLSDVASTNDKKFTTYDRDKESGLDYAMNRMYASTAGRMTSPDKGPIVVSKPSTLNRYAYGALDPINSVDPSGNFIAIRESKNTFWMIRIFIAYYSPESTCESLSWNFLECMEAFEPPPIEPFEVGAAGGLEPQGENFQRKAGNALSEARSKLGNLSTDCQGIFDALSKIVPNGNVLGRVREIMGGGKLQFIDGTTAQDTVGQLFGGPLNNASAETTVAQLFNPNLPRTIDGLSAPGGKIFFRESRLNWQNMIHEILHQVDQVALSDFYMLLALDALDPKRKIDVGTPANPGASTQISDFIKDKCK